jgi:ABC-type branched-subunit amino acid transport system ATPase component
MSSQASSTESTAEDVVAMGAADASETRTDNGGPGIRTEGSLGDLFDLKARPGTGSILRAERLEVAFGGVMALNHVSFAVNAGDVAAIVGPNGAGKSTLLNAMSGLLRSRLRGSIRYDGEEIVGHSPARIARSGVGRSFQDPPMIDSASVLENVLVGEHVRLGYRMDEQLWRFRRTRRLEEEARRRARTVLEYVGLGGVLDSKAGGLPYGSRKVIDIARAIVGGPQLLLLDEPTSGLDGAEQFALVEMLLRLHRETSVTIVIVEHHMEVVRRLANQVIGLQGGDVVADGPPADVLASESFLRALVGVSATSSEAEDVTVSDDRGRRS